MWPRSEERGNESSCLRASTLRSASMWPRSEERGNLVRPPSSSARSTLQCGRAPRSAEINQPLGSNTTSIFGFNVAALRGARKYSILYRPRARSFLRLQCGRAPRSAEIRRRWEQRAGVEAASMWPRSEERGNTYTPYPAGCRRSPGFNVAALRGARKSADGRRLAEPGELRFNVAALRGARKCRQERRTR